MTRLRHHSVSILAVLLALALGVALGGGPLSDLGKAVADDGGSGRDADTLAAELAAERTAGDYQDEVTSGLVPAAVKGQLTLRPVSIVVLPGADQQTVAALTAGVAQAGGTVSGRYGARPDLLAPDKKSLVDTLSSQVTEAVGTAAVAPDATTYVRMGQLIGRAVASVSDHGAATDQAATDILGSLRGAKLMSSPAETTQRGSLVLVVLGDEPTDKAGETNIYGGLLTGLASTADGVVVAGTTASATGGVLQTLRADDETAAVVSTVDSVQTEAGRLATVLALAQEKQGGPRHYGVDGTDGPLPQG
ncbi:copper transporter [Nocardioides guangzhouensis]|uniref:copper transporter n=1 Tax=Nocardioides guangzhouensis TaxID=2497878 RepID=UPI0014385EB7|nr:copper transporter [Nocardioides guangzhouensis]